MDKQFLDRFQQFVTARSHLIAEPDRFKAELKTGFTDAPRAVFLVLSALEEKVPQELLQAAGHVPAALTLQQGVRRLMEHRAMEAEAAHWAVHCWAFALGKAGDEPLVALPAPPGETAPEPEDPFRADAAPVPPRASRPPLIQTGQLPRECMHCDASLPQAQMLNRCPHCGKSPDGFAWVPPAIASRLEQDEKMLWLARPIRGPFMLIGLFPGIFGAGFAFFDLVFLVSAFKNGLNFSELLIFLLWGIIPGIIFAFLVLFCRSYPHVWYALTQRRFLIQHGTGGSDMTEIPLDKILAIQLEVGLFEQIFRAGSIKINAGHEMPSFDGSVRLSYNYLSALPRPGENYRRLKRLLARYADLELPEQVAQ